MALTGRLLRAGSGVWVERADEIGLQGGEYGGADGNRRHGGREDTRCSRASSPGVGAARAIVIDLTASVRRDTHGPINRSLS